MTFLSKRVKVHFRMFTSVLGHEIMLDTESVLSKKLKYPKLLKSGGETKDEIGEWKSSVWFGAFKYYEKGWLLSFQTGLAFLITR